MDLNQIDGLKLSTDADSRGKYLGDPAVVSALVRGFASHVLTLRSEWHGDAPDEKIDPTEEVQQLCALLGRVFLGQDDRFVPQPFNAPNRLGAVMRALVPTSGDPGPAFFEWFALQLVRGAIALEEGADLDAVRAELESITSDVIERLLGRATVSA